MSSKLLVLALATLFLMAGMVVSPSEGAKENYLRLSGGQDIKGINPFNPAFGDVYCALVKTNIWEYLYRYTPDFSENPEAKDSPDKRIFPWIAAEMPVYEKVGDKYEATVKLRDDVYWWDGKPLTADDVVFTGNLMLELRIPARYWPDWSITGEESYVESVQKVDDFTVKYVLKELVPLFQVGPMREYIYPKHQWDPIVQKAIDKFHKGPGEITEEERGLIGMEISSVDLGNDIKLDEIIGSGPFKPADWRKGEYMRLDANKDYWAKGRILNINGKDYKVGPYIDGILRKVYKSNDASVLAMKNGEVDITGISPTDIPDFQKFDTMKIENYTGNSLFYIGFNLRRKPMSYLPFRQAVAYLKNKELLNERVFHGRLPPIYSVVPFVNEYWLNPDLPTYGKGMNTVEREYKAYTILKEGGFGWTQEPEFKVVNGKAVELITKGEGLVMPDGKPCPEVKILGGPPEQIPDAAQANTMLQEWMRAVGIPATFTPIDFGTACDMLWPPDMSVPNYDINTIAGWSLGPDPGHIKDLWHSTQRPEITAGGANAEGYNDRGFDKLAEMSAREMDPVKRRAIIFKLQEMIAQDLPVYPTTTITRIQVYRIDRFEDWFNRPMYGISSYMNPFGYMIIKPK